MKINREYLLFLIATLFLVAIVFVVKLGFIKRDDISVRVDYSFVSPDKVVIDYFVDGKIPSGYKILAFSGPSGQRIETFGAATETNTSVLSSVYIIDYVGNLSAQVYVACIKSQQSSNNHYIQVLSKPESVEACGGTGKYYVCRPDRLGYYLYNDIDIDFEIVSFSYEDKSDNMQSDLISIECK